MGWVSRLFKRPPIRSSRRAPSSLIDSPQGRVLEPRVLRTSILPARAVSVRSLADIALSNLKVVSPNEIELTAVAGGTAQPVTLAVYRSSDAVFDAGDVQVASMAIPLDGSSRTIRWTLDRPLDTSLLHPYILVVADPARAIAEGDESNNVANVRKWSLAVVTHGGLQNTKNDRIPPWANRFSNELKAQGFDDVLAFNWVPASRTPGSVPSQAARLARQIRARLDAIPEGTPVDLHVVGHSQGTSLNGLALAKLAKDEPDALKSGFTRVVMLDPHPANNGHKVPQYSVKPSFMGWVAQTAVKYYRSWANDPPSIVPGTVDDAEVYYQHTYVAFTPNADQPWLNLWGHVPVAGNARYIDITGPGISHSGYFSVVDWYWTHVLPSLGSSQPVRGAALLTAGPDATTTRTLRVDPATGHIPERYWMHTTIDTPRFKGTSWAGGEVTLRAWPRGASTETPIVLGQTSAGADGVWSIESRALPDGRYTVIASASIPAHPDFPRVRMTPRIRVGVLEVNTDGTAPRTRNPLA